MSNTVVLLLSFGLVCTQINMFFHKKRICDIEQRLTYLEFKDTLKKNIKETGTLTPSTTPI